MNGTPRTGHDRDESADERLDPDLTRLFDEADAPSHADTFLRATLARLAEDRRRSFMTRCASVALMMAGGALLAPYVAQVTLTVTGWVAGQLPAAALALGSCACAVLLAWRVARRQLN